MALIGLDVSHHQGWVDWSQVVASGKVFAVVKRTEGTGFVDPRGFENAAGMWSAGLEFPGDYHFLSDRSDPIAQARHFVSTVGDPTRRLSALDVERTAAGGTPTSAMAHLFAAEYARLTGGHPLLVYTGRWYVVGVLGNPHLADIGPLWHSEYETTDLEIADGPELDHYGGWDGATFWQYTSSGRCPGVAGSVDLNLFFGDRAALRALTGLAPAPPTIPVSSEEDPMLELHASRWTGVNLLDAGGATWISDPATIDEQVRQGTPVRRMDANESDARRFIAERSSGVEEQIAASLDELVRVGQASHDDLVRIEEAIKATYARIVGPDEPAPSLRSDLA